MSFNSFNFFNFRAGVGLKLLLASYLQSVTRPPTMKELKDMKEWKEI